MEPKRRLTRSELVGAIFVAALCLGLIVPLLSNLGESRRRAICLNNLKVIGLAMRLYSGDCLEAFPTDPAATTVGTFELLARVHWVDPSTSIWIYGPFQPGYR